MVSRHMVRIYTDCHKERKSVSWLERVTLLIIVRSSEILAVLLFIHLYIPSACSVFYSISLIMGYYTLSEVKLIYCLHLGGGVSTYLLASLFRMIESSFFTRWLLLWGHHFLV